MGFSAFSFSLVCKFLFQGGVGGCSVHVWLSLVDNWTFTLVYAWHKNLQFKPPGSLWDRNHCNIKSSTRTGKTFVEQTSSPPKKQEVTNQENENAEELYLVAASYF